MESCYTTASDGLSIYTRAWRPEGEAKGVIVIAHGMSEHGERYARPAQRFAASGYAVFAHDHRGHGRTSPSAEALGHLADEDGWTKTVADIGTITDRARREFPDVPLVLIGHSMGSLLSRGYTVGASDRLDALVLTGTAGDPGLLGRAGLAIASTEARLRGRRARSHLMNKLTFGSFNSAFKPARTEFDWLTRDEAQVDAYIADPYCGVIPSAQFFVDLIGGTRLVNDDDVLRQIRPDLPVLLASGDADPVGGNGKDVAAVADQLRRVGLTDVTLTLYPGARHEVFNETNADEVIDNIIAWLDDRLVAARQ